MTGHDRIDEPMPRSRQHPFARTAIAVGAFLAVAAAFLFGIWMFSVNEFKAPNPSIVNVPVGFERLGDGSDGGSGGITNTYLALLPPETMDWPEAVDTLSQELAAEGWTASRHVGTDLQRGDALIGFRYATDWMPYELRHLEDLQPDDRRRVVVVNLTYVDLGVGRRSLTNH